jgi:Flp pilus assembly protein TadD
MASPSDAPPAPSPGAARGPAPVAPAGRAGPRPLALALLVVAVAGLASLVTAFAVRREGGPAVAAATAPGADAEPAAAIDLPTPPTPADAPVASPAADAAAVAGDAPADTAAPPVPGLTLIPIAELRDDDPPMPSLAELRAARGAPLVPRSAIGVSTPDEALASLDEQIAAAPDDIGLRAGRAVVLLVAGRTREGLATLDALARKHPTSPEPWAALAYVALRQGRFADAERLYGHVLELDPKHAESWRNRGILRRRLGRTRAGYQDLLTALRHDGDDVDALMELANLYDRAGRPHADTRALMLRVVALRPARVDVWLDLSVVEDDPRQAEEDVRRALALAPEDPRAHRELCRVLSRSSGAGALEACDAAAARNPKDAQVFMNRGLVHHFAGRSPAALADMDRAIALRPRDADYHVNRYLARMRAGKLTDARTDLEVACKLGHQNACGELRKPR